MAKRFLIIRRSRPYQYLKDKFLYTRAFLKWKMNPYPKEVGENPIFVFNHIPKCGGTSLNIVLRKWFHLVRDYPPHDLHFPDPVKWEKELIEFEATRLELSKIKPFQIISGHYELNRNRFSYRIGDPLYNPSLKCVSFLRDPLSHRLSMYKFGVKRGHYWVKGKNLLTYINSEINFFARVLECNESNYRQKLNSYFFIGIVEKYEESILELAELLNKSNLISVPHVNRTDSDSELEKLSKEQIEEFKKNNELDYLIYNYALNLLSGR